MIIKKSALKQVINNSKEIREMNRQLTAKVSAYEDLNAILRVVNEKLERDLLDEKVAFAQLQMNHVPRSEMTLMKLKVNTAYGEGNKLRGEISNLKDFISRQADMISRLINE